MEEVEAKINMEEVLKDPIEVDIKNKITSKISIKYNNQILHKTSWEELVCNNNQTYSKI